MNIAALAASAQQQQSLAVAQLMEERAKVEAKIRSLRQCDARQAELFLQGKRDAVYAFMQAELEKARTDNHAHLIRRYETYLKDFKQEHLYARPANRPGAADIRGQSARRIHHRAYSQQPIEAASPVSGQHGVLQRGQPVPVWGTCNPGGQVTVSFAGQTQQVTADASGQWTAYLDPLTASAQGRELVIASAARDHAAQCRGR